MKIADLYIRVSTDEQADKGYSQRDQEERLRKYCEINAFQVRKVIFEDHSAKTFNRPSWSKLLLELRRQRGHSDVVLFTKWDRFSRNAGDAYQMISTLRKLGVEPQAVEQPLDLSIPENKMMLAFYLAAPEVENDRRALNVFHGMRRAKKEGRYMGKAPLGYTNKITESGKKLIALKEGDAHLMRWVFDQLSQGIYNTEQVWKLARKKGHNCSRNNFWLAVRNPLYCGKIIVPKHKDEEQQVVQGQHEPLITEAQFYDVQDIITGRKRNLRTKVTVNENLPLRGFLQCPRCGKVLTGSASKGRSSYYYYYHCIASCGFRTKAEDANSKMADLIKLHTKPLPKLLLYKTILTEVYDTKTKNQRSDVQQLKCQIEDANMRLSKARDLLLEGSLEPDDYRIIKSETESNIGRIEAKLTATVKSTGKIEPLLDQAIASISQLDKLYLNGSTEQQRKIIGSIFPEKLTFDGLSYRTAKVNVALELMMLFDKKLRSKKNGTNHEFSDLSREVNPEESLYFA